MTPTETQSLTDGFHLLIDALKLNDINTIYGVPGIPITDLGRMAQAEGMRVLSFRHEQHAGSRWCAKGQVGATRQAADQLAARASAAQAERSAGGRVDC